MGRVDAEEEIAQTYHSVARRRATARIFDCQITSGQRFEHLVARKHGHT
jgi:hypothetical protein